MRVVAELAAGRLFFFGGICAAGCGLATAQGVGVDDAPADPPAVVAPDGDAGAPAVGVEPGVDPEAVPEVVPGSEPWRRWGERLSRPADLEAQRATAAELSGELDPLLGPDGLPRVLGEAQVRADLRGVATRCDLLVRSLTDTSALQRLYETQARVHNALVQDAAAHGESVEVARGLGKLREAAGRLADLESDNAAAAAGYWQMLADLIDANRTIDDTADRRVFVRELLSHYVEDFGDVEGLDPEVAGYVLDARVALARLLDEAGEQRAAVETLGPVALDDPVHERRGEVRGVLDRARALGRRIALDLPLASGGRWRVADHAGQPVLLHYYAAGQGGSAQGVAALEREIEAADLGGFSVASLCVDGVTQDTARPPWPLALVGPGEQQELAPLGLTSVPMYVWLDAEGRISAIGMTLDVVRRFPTPVEDAPARDDAPAEVPDAAAPQAPDPPAPQAAPDAAPDAGSR